MSPRVVLVKNRAKPVQLGEWMVVTCPGGAEPVLVREMESHGFADVTRETGAVRARRVAGADVAHANLKLRTASRVLVPVRRFPAESYDDVYAGVGEIPWETLLPTDRTFALTATARSETLRDHRFLAMRVKDGIVDRQRRVAGKRSSVDRQQPDLPVTVFAGDGYIEVSLDTTGTPLHERGYRTEQGEAPLRETVAAMMVLQAGWPAVDTLVDPFCGAGTIAIEAALISLGRAPGSLGRTFAWQRWDWLRESLQNTDRGAPERSETVARNAPGGMDDRRAAAPRILASDADPAMVAMARRNAERAGVADLISFSVQDAAEAIASAAARSERVGIVVANPPYGQRLQQDDTASLYRSVGTAVKRHMAGWTMWLILSDEAPAKALGLAPAQRIRVFNGGLAAHLARYDVHTPRRDGGSGSSRSNGSSRETAHRPSGRGKAAGAGKPGRGKAAGAGKPGRGKGPGSGAGRRTPHRDGS